MALKRSASRRDVIRMQKLAEIEGMTNVRIAKRMQMDIEVVKNFLGDDTGPETASPEVVAAETEAAAEESVAAAEELTPQQKAAITRKANAEKKAKADAE